MKIAHRAGAVSLILANVGLGQTLYPEIKLSAGAGPINHETAIGVSRTTDDILAVWQSPSRLRYAASINGGLTFGEWSDLTPPLCADTPNGFDPMVAESQYTGELWAGGISGAGAVGAVFVARKAAGSFYVVPSIVVTTADCPVPPLTYNDKAFMTVGPVSSDPSNETQAMYATWSITNGQFYLRAIKSEDSGPPGFLWPGASQGINSNINGTVRQGKGAYPVVIQHGVRRKRLIVGSGVLTPTEYTFSDSYGVEGTWRQPPIQFTQYQSPGTLLRGFLNSGILWIDGGLERAVGLNWPSVALDPNDSSNVFFAMAGRRHEDTQNNADIFIAHVNNGGQVDPTVTVYPPDRVFHFDDADLRMPGEGSWFSHEFLPSVAVDEYGGINLLFVRCLPGIGVDTPPRGIAIRYARWSSAAALSGPPEFIADLVPLFVPIGPAYVAGSAGNDYQMIKAKGCYVHALYVHQDAQHEVHVYYRRIYICAPADLTANQAVDGDDVLAFAEAFAAGSGRADANHDGTLDVSDATAFLEAFNSATRP